MPNAFEEAEEKMVGISEAEPTVEAGNLQPLDQSICGEYQSPDGVEYEGPPPFEIATDQIDTLSNQIAKLMAGSNRIFNQSGMLVAIENVPQVTLRHYEWVDGEKKLVRTTFPQPKQAGVQHIMGAAQYCGKYWKEDKRRKSNQKWSPVELPTKIALQIAVTKAGKFKPLRTVVGHPLLQSNGEWVSGYGYDPVTSLIYSCDPAEVSGFESAQVAWEFLKELFSPIPWKTEADFARYIMFMLTTAMAKAACFPAKPLFGFRAPDPNSGKTFATKLVGLVVEKRSPSVMTHSRDKAEQKKALASAMMSCPTLLIIDNLPNGIAFNDEDLNACATLPIWETRLLGLNSMVKISTDPTITLTGNSWSTKGDMTSRMVMINLELAGDHDPKIFDLEARVVDNRDSVLGALQAIVAMAPEYDLVSNRFPVWSRTVAWPVVSVSCCGDALKTMSEGKSEYADDHRRALCAKVWLAQEDRIATEEDFVGFTATEMCEQFSSVLTETLIDPSKGESLTPRSLPSLLSNEKLLDVAHGPFRFRQITAKNSHGNLRKFYCVDGRGADVDQAKDWVAEWEGDAGSSAPDDHDCF